MKSVALALTLILLLSLSTSLAQERVPDAGQALVRILWGHRAQDNWDSTFTGQDSVSYAFLFVNNATYPVNVDTLDLPASAVLIVPDVTCTLTVYGDSLDYIDQADPSIIKAGESLLLGSQIRWFHLGVSGAGLIRVWGFAD